MCNAVAGAVQPTVSTNGGERRGAVIALLAYDATREGQERLLRAPELEWLSGAQIHLLAVMPVAAGLFLGEGHIPAEVVEEERTQAELLVEEGLAGLSRRGLAAVGHLTFGEPVEEICRAAREVHAALIIVRHAERRSFAARWWKGWVGSSLLEHTPSSVLISVST
jgi:nucleotide-binding universal stress UspA family protein